MVTAPPVCYSRELHERIHGSDQRPLRGQGGGLPAGRRQPAQHHDPARPRRGLLREELHRRPQSGEGSRGNHGKKDNAAAYSGVRGATATSPVPDHILVDHMCVRSVVWYDLMYVWSDRFHCRSMYAEASTI